MDKLVDLIFCLDEDELDLVGRLVDGHGGDVAESRLTGSLGTR
jgi:hypothetical protein